MENRMCFKGDPLSPVSANLPTLHFLLLSFFLTSPTAQDQALAEEMRMLRHTHSVEIKEVGIM